MKSLRPMIGVCVLGVASLAGSAVGCAHEQAVTQTMTTSAIVPGGEGTVRASRADNGNTAVSVSVKHLAPPSKVAPNATVYVVWIKPPNGTIQNAGALRVDSNLTGSLEALTPFMSFRVMVTPEPNAQVAAPSHQPVLTSEVNRPG
jgi:hypothetical protein